LYLTKKFSYVLPDEQRPYSWFSINAVKDKPIIDALVKVQKQEFGFYEQVLTAITLFNESCRVKPFNESSSIVLITSAFEALLQIPRSEKKRNFGYAFKIHWGYDENIKKWAEDLYELRSHIVHGATVKPDVLLVGTDKHYPHFDIAREIFHDLLLIIFDNKGLLTVDKGNRRQIIANLQSKVISNKQKIKEILSQKERYTYEAFTNDPKIYLDFLQKISTLNIFDQSSEDNIITLLRLIFAIAEKGLDEELREIRKIDINTVKDEFSRLYLQTLRPNELKKFKKYIKLLPSGKTLSYRERFDLHDNLNEFYLAVCQNHQFRPDLREIKFRVGEFLLVCLESMRFLIY
jgi:hypothetical protein